jgi:hypothetical protein
VRAVKPPRRFAPPRLVQGGEVVAKLRLILDTNVWLDWLVFDDPSIAPSATPSARNCMTGPCFVDANVLVYARDARHASKQARAAHWIARLWQEQLGRTSVQVLSEYHAVTTRKLTPRVPLR